ncbi:MAG: glycosyltransferase [Rickettsiales bacterium]|jgi:glycosyltransferase involved in cell wall biosynthesis|nr:glycosyltransferase [Rickettsiales bacterium]
MKILHVVDSGFFEQHRKTVVETLLALADAGVEQAAYAPEGETLGGLDARMPLAHFKVAKDGRASGLSNRIRAWRMARTFGPDIAIKWGPAAREAAPSGGFVQVSFVNERENLRRFDRADYVMTNLDSVLSWAKNNGFSGTKSFMLPSFVYEYKNMPPVLKRDFFIPEKAKIIYISGNFSRGIGYETLFDAIPSLVDVYFFIAGAGRDEEYIKDCASRANVKSRSRFIPEIERTQAALSLSDFALLPFDSSETAKDILEAQAAGKVVLTLRTDSAKEFVSEGKTGFTVPKGDSYLLRRRIKEIISMDADEKRKIAEAALESASQYRAAKVVPGYVSAFEELVAKYRSRKNLLH